MIDDPLDCVTLDEAAKLLGGNKPFSRTTIQRMIRDGVLVARGAGMLRRVTLASVNAYRRGEVPWRGDVRAATAPPTKTERASGGRKSRSETAKRDGRVRLIGRTPSRNSRSS